MRGTRWGQTRQEMGGKPPDDGGSTGYLRDAAVGMLGAGNDESGLRTNGLVTFEDSIVAEGLPPA